MSSSNDLRSQAENIFNLCKQTYPDSLILKLAQLLHTSLNPETRTMSTILLRRHLTRHHDDSFIYPHLTASTQSTLRSLLLSSLHQEPVKSIAKKLCDTISELASALLSEDLASWPDLLPLLFQLFTSPDARLQEISLLVFAQLAHYIGETLIPQLSTLHSVFLRSLSAATSSSDVRIAALAASINFVQCLSNPSDRDRIEEAEAQCALLNSESLCDGCFSSDSDIFLFGARTVYREICLGDGGYVVCYEMAEIENKLGLGRDSLIALSLLLGSDYHQGVHGLGPELACQIVKSIREKDVLKKFASEGLGWVKKRKGIYTLVISILHFSSILQLFLIIFSIFFVYAGAKNNIGKDDTILQVIDAYLKPKCHSADSDFVLKAHSQYPFQRTKLHHICAVYFEWPSERTAERDLRRFANLRSTSSELGLNLPLHE
ncbi:hypothetical protein RYX36_013699, partial [Vicia faba]